MARILRIIRYAVGIAAGPLIDLIAALIAALALSKRRRPAGSNSVVAGRRHGSERCPGTGALLAPEPVPCTGRRRSKSWTEGRRYCGSARHGRRLGAWNWKAYSSVRWITRRSLQRKGRVRVRTPGAVGMVERVPARNTQRMPRVRRRWTLRAYPKTLRPHRRDAGATLVLGAPRVLRGARVLE